MPTSGTTRARLAVVAAYGWWVVAGACFGFGVAGLLTFGGALIAAALAMAGAGAAIPRLRNAAPWPILVGASAGPWYLAWLNRSGPGTACQTHGDETSCMQQWSPWPFVAVGIALLAAGLGWQLRARRRSPRDGPGGREPPQTVTLGGTRTTDQTSAARQADEECSHHFGSVQDLLLAVLAAGSARRMATLGTQVDAAATPSELIDVLETVVTQDIRSGDLAALLAAARGNPDLAQAVRDQLQPRQKLTERTIHRIADGHPSAP